MSFKILFQDLANAFKNFFKGDKGKKPVEPEDPVIPDPPTTPEDDRANYWINKFPFEPVLYSAQDGNLRDVRTFVFDRSFILDMVINRYNLRGVNDDETMLKCCLFIQDHVRYVGDMEARGQAEFWQNPEDTVARSAGDCEDGAILMKSLTLCAGIPDWKVKIVAGAVEGGGHAYCTYIRDDDTQCIMDWCYWPIRLPVNERVSLEEEPCYYDIWFSFNNEYSYAEAKTLYANGKVIKQQI